MYIYDEEKKVALSSVTLILNIEEMHQLKGYVNQLLQENLPSDHYHLSSSDYQKEITLLLYRPENFSQLHSEIKKLISSDTNV